MVIVVVSGGGDGDGGGGVPDASVLFIHYILVIFINMTTYQRYIVFSLPYLSDI